MQNWYVPLCRMSYNYFKSVPRKLQTKIPLTVLPKRHRSVFLQEIDGDDEIVDCSY